VALRTVKVSDGVSSELEMPPANPPQSDRL